MAKRSNPFAGDGKASGIRKAHIGLTSNESVRVEAHTRRKPVRDAAKKLLGVGKLLQEKEADNAFSGSQEQFSSPQGPQAVSGLQRPGDRPVNHLKGAISLMNRSRV